LLVASAFVLGPEVISLGSLSLSHSLAYTLFLLPPLGNSLARITFVIFVVGAIIMSAGIICSSSHVVWPTLGLFLLSAN
jgi:hypothetical protein